MNMEEKLRDAHDLIVKLEARIPKDDFIHVDIGRAKQGLKDIGVESRNWENAKIVGIDKNTFRRLDDLFQIYSRSGDFDIRKSILGILKQIRYGIPDNGCPWEIKGTYLPEKVLLTRMSKDDDANYANGKNVSLQMRREYAEEIINLWNKKVIEQEEGDKKEYKNKWLMCLAAIDYTLTEEKDDCLQWLNDWSLGDIEAMAKLELWIGKFRKEEYGEALQK